MYNRSTQVCALLVIRLKMGISKRKLPKFELIKKEN